MIEGGSMLIKVEVDVWWDDWAISGRCLVMSWAISWGHDKRPVVADQGGGGAISGDVLGHFCAMSWGLR